MAKVTITTTTTTMAMMNLHPLWWLSRTPQFLKILPLPRTVTLQQLLMLCPMPIAEKDLGTREALL
jgi:hypothetical protein